MTLLPSTCKNCKETDNLSSYPFQNLDQYEDYEIYSNLEEKIKEIQPESRRFDQLFDFDVRSAMIDWMLYIKHELSLRDETLFLSVNIFDRTIFIFKGKLRKYELHLIGLVCLYIACKYEEVNPILLTNLIRITHGKFTKQDIISTEILILQKLSFKLSKDYFMDSLYLTMVKINKLKDGNLCKCYTKIYTYSIMIYKLSLYDLPMTNYHSRHSVVNLILYIALNKYIEDNYELQEIS